MTAQQPQVIYRPATTVQAPATTMQAVAPGAPIQGQTVRMMAPTTYRQAVPGAGYNVGSARVMTTPQPAGTRVIRTSVAPGQLGGTARTVIVGQASTHRPNTIGGPAYSQGTYEAKHQKDEQLNNLKDLRRTSGLKEVPVAGALQTFKGKAEDGQLTRENFLLAYGEILATMADTPPVEEVKNAVFDLFDRDDNNIVDMMELICGISLLCGGSEEEKIAAVFGVFDENGDGYISMDEMYKFLTSVFKVVLTPAVIGAMNSMGVDVESAEDLASVTSLECFKTADLNQDGRLSIEEFKNWFWAPKSDPSFLLSPVRTLLQ